MKKPTALLKIFVTAGFLAFFLLNTGSLRCESSPGGRDNLSPQANRSGPELGKSRDQSWLEEQDQNDKNERFKELEWLIKQRLLKQYERMETADYLEDNSD